MSSSRDLPIQRLAIGICIAVVLLTGVAVGLFVHPYHAVAYEALVKRSTAIRGCICQRRRYMA